jgi:hypothetical protein
MVGVALMFRKDFGVDLREAFGERNTAHVGKG